MKKLLCLLSGPLLLAAAVTWGGSAPAPEKPELRSRFLNPPAEHRILKIIHGWPDKPEAQDERIKRLQAQGFGGVVCNVAFDGGYVESEAKWAAFLRGVREAKKAGFAMWLYDEKGYPSGNAGGIVLRDQPDWQARGLLIADAETSGTNVALPAPPGKLVLAAAFPVSEGRMNLAGRQDLTDRLKAGALEWQPPPGRWRVMIVTEDKLYEGTHAAHNVYAHIPYVNLLQPEVTAKFLQVTHQRYAEKLDRNLGNWFMATFTDEPSLMSLFLSPMPYRVLPWSDNLKAEFQQRRGQALEPLIPALVADCGPASRKARHDFWLTVGELVAENFFGQIQDWCRRHNLPSGGHLLFEETPLNQVASYGDFYRCIRRLDAPSVDMLTSLPPEVPAHIGRLLASAGELRQRTLVMSETSDHSQRYRPAGDQRPVRVVTEAEIRGTLNRQMAGGVNCFTSYYSFKDLADEQLRRLNEYVGRCCALLRQGRQEADLAVVYPTESLWVRFEPSRHGTRDAREAAPVANSYLATVKTLFNRQQDYTVLDATALTEARARGRQLTHGALGWNVVILPWVDTLPLAAWENLAALARGGGVVIALGLLPANSETEFPSPRVRQLGREIFGATTDRPAVQASPGGGGGIFLPEGTEALLPRLLEKLLEAPQLRIVEGPRTLRVTHRRADDGDTFFIANDSPLEWSGRIDLRIPSSAISGGELWWPATGRIEKLAAARNLPLRLGVYDAVLVRCPAALPASLAPLQTGVLPGLALRPLPAAEPAVSGGEFVKKELAPDAARGRAGLPAWRALGTLTKAQVDTHLFTRLAYPQKLDLQNAEFLVLDTWTPENQKTSAKLLVILHEAGGADYLADTGRSLGGAGFKRVYVPLDQFKLAGWSKDPNQRLDLNDITEVRVGWGGYFGQKEEQVEFSFALPQVAGFPSPARGDRP